MKTTITLTIEHKKPISDLLDKVAGRSYTIQGVDDVTVTLDAGWLPIESAPKDGSSYLVADSARGFVAPHIRGVIHNNPGTEWDWQYGEACTHWMPLPPAP